MAAKKTQEIFQLKVSLKQIVPPIWRSIQVPEDTKLSRLHRIIQAIFNWESYHLHEFRYGERIFREPDPEEDAFNGREVADEAVVPLNQIVSSPGATFDYVYDFGDDWYHSILLEAVLPPEPERFYPYCVDGARNGPPEDSGGPFGYANYLEALSDPEHEEHEDMLAWRGVFDSEAFSVDSINASLRRTFLRRTRKTTRQVSP